MSGNQNGGGGGCIVLSIGDERHTHALATKTENVLRPIRLAFELPAVRHEHHTNGGGGGCIRVRIGKVEHEIACKPSDEIELQFDFGSS
jgi:hypothetical protein